MKLLARLFSHLMSLLPTPRSLSGVASWNGPQPLRMTRAGKSGVAAARKARNRRRARNA